MKKTNDEKLVIDGYECRIRKVETGSHYMDGGWYCGYITLPEGHTWLTDNYENSWEIPVEVHGGITYKHENEIGFDCAHCDDMGWKFETRDYVIDQIKSMIKQAKEAVCNSNGQNI